MLFTIGIFLIIVGVIFKMFPPKKINSIAGYRTTLSMKNQDTWNEAQRFSAISFIILGIVYVVLGLIIYLINQLFEAETILFEFIVFMAGVAINLIIDERHLRKNFNKDGSRKC